MKIKNLYLIPFVSIISLSPIYGSVSDRIKFFEQFKNASDNNKAYIASSSVRPSIQAQSGVLIPASNLLLNVTSARVSVSIPVPTPVIPAPIITPPVAVSEVGGIVPASVQSCSVSPIQESDFTSSVKKVADTTSQNLSGINSSLDSLVHTIKKDRTRFWNGLDPASASFGSYRTSLSLLALKLKQSIDDTEDLIFGKSEVYTGRDKIHLSIDGQSYDFGRGGVVSRVLLEKLLNKLSPEERKNILNYWSGGEFEKRVLYPVNKIISDPIVKLLVNTQPLMISAVGLRKYEEKDKFRFHVPVAKGVLGDLGFIIPSISALVGPSYPSLKGVVEQELFKMFSAQKDYMTEIKNVVASKMSKKGNVMDLKVMHDVTTEGLMFSDKAFGLYFSPLSYPLYSMSLDNKESKEKEIAMYRDLVHEIRHSEQWLWTLEYCRTHVSPCFYLEGPERGEEDIFKQTRNDIRDISAYRKMNRELLAKWRPRKGFMSADNQDEKLSKKLWARYDVGGSLLTEPKPISLPAVFSMAWPKSVESKILLRKFYRIYWAIQCQGEEVRDVDASEVLTRLRNQGLVGSGREQALEKDWKDLIHYEKNFTGYMNDIVAEKDAYKTEEIFENKMRAEFGLPLLTTPKEVCRFKGYL